MSPQVDRCGPELLSVVVPLRDEEGTVRELCRRIDAAVAEVPFELILVDDASTDGTAGLLDAPADGGPPRWGLHLARRLRDQAAFTARPAHAPGGGGGMLSGAPHGP